MNALRTCQNEWHATGTLLAGWCHFIPSPALPTPQLHRSPRFAPSLLMLHKLGK
jgi:hypothetical protein